MSRTEFLRELASLLGASATDLTPERELASLPGWDSMGQLSTLSLLDEIGVHPPKGALQNCRAVADLLRLAEPSLRP